MRSLTTPSKYLPEEVTNDKLLQLSVYEHQWFPLLLTDINAFAIIIKTMTQTSGFHADPSSLRFVRMTRAVSVKREESHKHQEAII
jgi:hypothetical protein